MTTTQPLTPEQIEEWAQACQSYPQRYVCGTEQPPIIVPGWLWDAMEQHDTEWFDQLRTNGLVVRHQPRR
ncbi:hypothetical protein AB0H76_15275 [Nocardia sp. NPDC050712]|uniref:hypothetical protein n=1 Tax=Nocardia sp. NPDC050712 TaxID=3155518 RepID=UPI0033D3FADD